MPGHPLHALAATETGVQRSRPPAKRPGGLVGARLAVLGAALILTGCATVPEVLPAVETSPVVSLEDELLLRFAGSAVRAARLAALPRGRAGRGTTSLLRRLAQGSAESLHAQQDALQTGRFM